MGFNKKIILGIILLLGIEGLVCSISYARRVKYVQDKQDRSEIVKADNTFAATGGGNKLKVALLPRGESVASMIGRVQECMELIKAFLKFEENAEIPEGTSPNIAGIVKSLFRYDEEATIDDVLQYGIIAARTGREFESSFPKRLPPDIEVVRDTVSNSAQLECFEYVMGKEAKTTPQEVNKFISELLEHEVSMPKPGDIVIYFDLNDRPVHIARYFGDGYVISKWSIGPVFRHPVQGVPDCWKMGLIRFFRPDISK